MSPEEDGTIDVRILLSSGQLDDWESIDECTMSMDLGGALLILCKYPDGHPHGGQQYVVAMYAPGMWMKMEQLER